MEKEFDKEMQDELQDDLLLGAEEEDIVDDLDDDMILDEEAFKVAESYLSDEMDDEEDMGIDLSDGDEEEESELDFERRPRGRFYDEEDVEEVDIDFDESKKADRRQHLIESRRHHRKVLGESKRPLFRKRLTERAFRFSGKASKKDWAEWGKAMHNAIRDRKKKEAEKENEKERKDESCKLSKRRFLERFGVRKPKKTLRERKMIRGLRKRFGR